MVTLLLPPKTLHESCCYEAAFLGNWQVFHLDCLDDAESPALVASILSPSLPEVKEPVVSQDELQKDLWAAVARLPASEAMRASAEAWVHEGKGFYSGAALHTRVNLLWELLTEPDLNVCVRSCMSPTQERWDPLSASFSNGTAVFQNAPACLRSLDLSFC